MPPQEIIDGPSSFLLETLETCIGRYDDLYDEVNCLNLNIFVPSQALNGYNNSSASTGIERTPLPVLVWIYGGALRRGGNGVCLYDATNFVARSIALGQPVIVVVPNYRVNYLGFISSNELLADAASSNPASECKQSVGNWGLQDLILALEWVQSHIHLFSGNTSMITLAGESAGAVCVNDLMLIKKAQNLFQRAILQSGSTGTLPPMYPGQDGQLYFDHLWRKFGTSEDNGTVDAHEKVEILRRVPAKDLAYELKTYDVTFFRPTIDGVLIEDNLWSRESRSKLDQGLRWVLAGCCRDEGTLLVPVLGADTLEKFDLLRSRLSPPSSYSVFDRLYGVPKSNAEASTISSQLINDGFFQYPLYRTSQTVLESGSCYMSRFHFDCVLEEISKGDPTVGAHHGSDLLFMFGSDTVLEHLTEAEKVLARQMQDTWIEFATAPDPAQSWIPKVRRRENDGASIGDRATCASEPGDFKEQNQALWFKEDLTMGRAAAERLSEEKVAFWRTSFEYQMQQTMEGRSADVGFNLFKMLE
ncbi:hypothetical protein BGX34_010121 [Mortierella sp. NVP85]|nr:hypothetical protein BGX34_010121 [Mortierella sp. NVP85]